jgi:hypothetical protein
MEKLNNKNRFCIKPFNSVDISTNGDIRPCCVLQNNTEFKGKNTFNVKDVSIQEYWNSDYLKYLRQKFLNNSSLIECNGCWINEKEKIISHRELGNKEHKILFKTNYLKYLKLLKKDNLEFPEDISLSITNLCNLKCQMCSGASSSKLLVENNDLGFSTLNQIDYDWGDEIKLKTIEEITKHDLYVLKLIGGETLMVPDVIILLENLVKNKKSKNIFLQITTNGTQCNKKILFLLSQFKKVRLIFSIESTGKYNNYLRFPSSWQKIENNIKKFKTLKNMDLNINTVVQNLNILYLDNIIKFAHNINSYIRLSLLHKPTYLQLTNLPIELLIESKKKLDNIDKKILIHSINFNSILKIINESILENNFNTENFLQFKNMIKKRDSYRKIHIKDFMPELSKYIYN